MLVTVSVRCALFSVFVLAGSLLSLAQPADLSEYIEVDAANEPPLDPEADSHVEYSRGVFQEDASDGVDETAKSGYSQQSEKKKTKKQIVEVFVPEEEKRKMKIISVDKGFYVQGGTQLIGKFVDLKHCMKACAVIPSCFAADYNPWLNRCYTHGNLTACNTMSSNQQYIHFSKVPCKVTDAPTGSVTLGVSVPNGIEQKGVEGIQQCMKTCATAGGGVKPLVFGTTAAALIDAFGSQACFAIDYDFATHKCYFFGSNVIATADDNNMNLAFIFQHCPAGFPFGAIPPTGTPISLNTQPNPTVVHITFCPVPAQGAPPAVPG